MLLCLASPLGQLIDLFSQFAFLSPCLLLSLSCIPICLASCLLVISLLTKSTIGFQTKEPARKHRNRATAASRPKSGVIAPKLAAVRIPASPQTTSSLARHWRYFTASRVREHGLHRGIRWSGGTRIRVFLSTSNWVPMSWDFAKRFTPLESRHGKADHYRSTHHDAATRSLCGASTRSLPSAIGLATTRSPDLRHVSCTNVPGPMA